MFTKADIEKYFNAEKSESLLFIVIGITAILLALIFFLYLKTNWHKGFGIPFLIVGLMHLAVGYTVYKRCDADRKRNVYAYDMNPGDFKTSEIPRMEKVNSNFVVYRFTEIALLLAGAALFFIFGITQANLFGLALVWRSPLKPPLVWEQILLLKKEPINI